MSNQINISNTIPKSQLLYYGLLGIPIAMLGIPLYLYLPVYYHETYGLSLAVIGFALLAARLFDVITDPAMGWISDQLNPRLNRVWQVLIGILFLLFAVYQLFFPNPNSLSGWTLFIWSFLTYLAWTWVQVPYLSLATEITENYFAKSQLTASREGLSIIGVMTVLILPVALNLDLKSPDFYWIIFVLLIGLFISACAFLFKVNQLPLPTIGNNAQCPFKMLKALWKEDRDVFDIMPLYFLNSLANALPATLFLIFVSDFLKLDSDKGFFLIVYFVAGILALPFWMKVSKKIGKTKSWQLSMLLASFSFSGVFLLESGDFTGFLIISILTGFSLGIDLAMPASIQADIIQKTSKGTQVAGLLFGVWGMLTKLSLALAVGLAFPIIEYSTQLGLESTTTLVVLYAGIPILLKLIAVYGLKELSDKVNN
jgi:Na+/melibiose symporter-like transporter